MRIEIEKKLALVAQERSYSYEQFFGLSDLLAGSFPAAGEMVAICAENSAAWLMALYGGWRHGNIVVPLDYLSTPEELAYMLNDCQPALLCCSDKTLAVAQQAVELNGNRCRLFNLSKFDQPEDVLAQKPLERDNNEVALILYTSGTTGSPKGVQITFGNLQINLDSGCARDVVAPDGSVKKGCPIFNKNSRCIIILPLHHILPLLFTGILPLYSGSSFYLCPSLSGADIQATLAKYHITVMIAVPRLFEVIGKSIKEAVTANFFTNMLYHLSLKVNSLAFSRLLFKKVHAKFGGELQFCISGGAALGPEIFEDLKAFGFEILEGFGMTEAAPLISFSWPGRARQGTAGQVAPGVEVKIIDGEICARGANIMHCYYNRPAETAAILRDGWLHTGDLGAVDVNGYLTITGRSKEILVLKNGKNVNPAEVESKLLASTPYLKEAAVLLKNGQLHAILVPSNLAFTSAGVANICETFNNEIILPYNQQVSPAKRLMGYTVSLQDLPRTRLGKIKRFELDELLKKLAAGTSELPEENPDEYSSSAKVLVDYLTAQLGCPIRLSHHLEVDLGMDSLDKVALLSFIESSFGIIISEQELAGLYKIGSLAAYLEDHKTKLELKSEDWPTILAKCGSANKLPQSGLLHGLLFFAAKLVARIFLRFKISGRENLPARPALIVANHQSYADGLFLSFLMSRRLFKKTVFLAKQKHFDTRLKSFIARRCNIIVMDLHSNVKESMQEMAQALRQGYNVVVFPEGTRSPDGQLAPFKRSFAIVAAAMNVPVVPAVIRGAGQAIPRGRTIPVFGSRVELSLLPPLEAGGLDEIEFTSRVYQQIDTELNRPSDN